MLGNGWTYHPATAAAEARMSPLPCAEEQPALGSAGPSCSSHNSQPPELFPGPGFPLLSGTEPKWLLVPASRANGGAGAMLGTPPGDPGLLNPYVGYFPQFPC